MRKVMFGIFWILGVMILAHLAGCWIRQEVSEQGDVLTGQKDIPVEKEHIQTWEHLVAIEKEEEIEKLEKKAKEVFWEGDNRRYSEKSNDILYRILSWDNCMNYTNNTLWFWRKFDVNFTDCLIKEEVTSLPNWKLLSNISFYKTSDLLKKMRKTFNTHSPSWEDNIWLWWMKIKNILVIKKSQHPITRDWAWELILSGTEWRHISSPFLNNSAIQKSVIFAKNNVYFFVNNWPNWDAMPKIYESFFPNIDTYIMSCNWKDTFNWFSCYNGHVYIWTWFMNTFNRWIFTFEI